MSENRKRSVGKRCVAYGCSTKYGDGFALHLFPTNADLCKMWTNFVQKKRDKWDGPTTYSALCEKHFEDGSYPMKYAILRSMGQTPPKKKVLNADAIPTIQTAVQAEPMDDVSQLASPLFASTPKPKKPRSAFMKRQNRRIINEILIDGQTKDISGEEPMDTDQDDTTPTVLETPTVQNGSCISISTTRTCGTQLAFKKPCARTVRVQVTPLTKEKGCQTTNKPKMKNVEVQCNILKPAKDKLHYGTV